MSATELPEPGTITSEFQLKVKSNEVRKWPEWQEFAARLGIPLTRHVTGCVVHLNCQDVARVSLTYIPWNHSCPQPHADTPRTDTSGPHRQAETTPTPVTSVDTPSDGTEQP